MRLCKASSDGVPGEVVGRGTRSCKKNAVVDTSTGEMTLSKGASRVGGVRSFPRLLCRGRRKNSGELECIATTRHSKSTLSLKKKMRQCQGAQTALFVIVGVHKSQKKKAGTLPKTAAGAHRPIYIIYKVQLPLSFRCVCSLFPTAAEMMQSSQVKQIRSSERKNENKKKVSYRRLTEYKKKELFKKAVRLNCRKWTHVC